MKITAIFGFVIILAAFDLMFPIRRVEALPVIQIRGSVSTTETRPPQVSPSKFSPCYVQVPGHRGPVWVSSDNIPQGGVVNVAISTGRISGAKWYTCTN